MECSITNIGGCIAEALFGFIVDLINMSLSPFIEIVKRLMVEQVSISLFSDVWASIVYVLSLFYGILLIYVGFKFIISGESPEEREKAKNLLRNTIIMIILIQTSYYLYELIISISSGLTSAMMKIAGNNFFYFSSDSVTNIGLQIIFSGLYIICMIITSLFLTLRYIFVSIGVIFFVIAIFFYFVPFLNGFGRLILNWLGVLIFLPFFYSLVFVGASRLVLSDSLSDIKILVVIGSFTLLILGTLILILYVIVKSINFGSKIIAPVVLAGKAVGVI